MWKRKDRQIQMLREKVRELEIENQGLKIAFEMAKEGIWSAFWRTPIPADVDEILIKIKRRIANG